MANNNAINLDVSNESDGFTVGGGTSSKRTLGISGGDVDIVGGGSISDGDLLIGDSGNSKHVNASPTAGSNISLTKGAGTLEIAVTDKTGADAHVVTGTAGSNGEVVQWNGDGDAVSSGVHSDSIKDGSVVLNGRISVSVASNNISVALKTLAGNDPSSSSPVYVRIDNGIRTITSALSVTKNAGTNWFASGSSELSGQIVDYFVYLGYNATDGVTIGFARIPWGEQYDSFSATSTNAKYCAISTIANAVATDQYVNIGRFAATLTDSGGAYNWSVPTFTHKNLIQRPIFETRFLTFTPTFAASGSMTFTSVTVNRAQYKLKGVEDCFLQVGATGATGGSASNSLTCTLPMSSNLASSEVLFGTGGTADTNIIAGLVFFLQSDPTRVYVRRYDAANFGLGASRQFLVNTNYKV